MSQQGLATPIGKDPVNYDHVYILHTHTSSTLIARLVRILRQTCKNVFILISHDQTAHSLPLDLRGVPDVEIISGPGGREGFAIVDGYLNALRWLERQGIRYGWVSNLSGEDYPIRSMREFLDYCNKTHDADAFIHHFDAFKANQEAMNPWTWDGREGHNRYHFKYLKLMRESPRPMRAAVWPIRKSLDKLRAPWRINPSYGLMFGTYSAKTPFTADFRCFAGSYWHTINASASACLMRFVGEHPDAVAYFRSTLQPEEAFVQTVLANASKLKLQNDNLRLIDMTNSKHGRPKIFQETDLPAIVSSGKFFARKVTSDSVRLLDKLDEYAAS